MVHAAHALFADLSSMEDQRDWEDFRLREQFEIFARDRGIMSPTQFHAWVSVRLYRLFVGPNLTIPIEHGLPTSGMNSFVGATQQRAMKSIFSI